MVFVVPAFSRMFREVGVNLPDSTDFVLRAGGWAATWPGAAALVALLVLLRRAARTRTWLAGAVLFAGVALVVLMGLALFAPCVEITRKL